MKKFVSVAAIFATVWSAGVGATLEDVSPHFGTNTAIVWQAPTNHLPERFWTYKRLTADDADSAE